MFEVKKNTKCLVLSPDGSGDLADIAHKLSQLGFCPELCPVLPQDLYQRCSSDIGFILIDGHLNTESCFELCRELVLDTRLPNIPVIPLFPQEYGDSIKEVLSKYGIHQYIKTPLNPGQLARVVVTALKHTSTNQFECRMTKIKEQFIDKKYQESLDGLSYLDKEASGKNIRVKYGISKSYSALGDMASSERELQNAMALDEENFHLKLAKLELDFKSWGSLLRRKDDDACREFQESLAEIVKGIKNSAARLKSTLVMLMRIRLVDEAAVVSDNSRDIIASSFDSGLLLVAGKVYLMARRPDSALDALSRASDQCSSTWNLRGIIYSMQNKFDQSVISYEKAIYISPNEPRLYLNLAKSYFSSRNHHKALKNALRAQALNPNEPGVEDFIAFVQKSEGGAA
jgi:tetratricopeptide (TPR) repeat protein